MDINQTSFSIEKMHFTSPQCRSHFLWGQASNNEHKTTQHTLQELKTTASQEEEETKHTMKDKTKTNKIIIMAKKTIGIGFIKCNKQHSHFNIKKIR